MKKSFSLLTIFVIGLFLIPNIVNAAETKTVNGRTYVIDDAYEFEIEKVTKNLVIKGTYNDDLYLRDNLVNFIKL